MSPYTNIRKGSLNNTKWGSKMHHLSFRPLIVLNSEVNFKKEQTPSGVCSFFASVRGFEPSRPPLAEGEGGRGLGARALAVRDQASATGEKIRRIGRAPPRTRPMRLYFRVGLSNPTDLCGRRKPIPYRDCRGRS